MKIQKLPLVPRNEFFKNQKNIPNQTKKKIEGKNPQTKHKPQTEVWKDTFLKLSTILLVIISSDYRAFISNAVYKY